MCAFIYRRVVFHSHKIYYTFFLLCTFYSRKSINFLHSDSCCLCTMQNMYLQNPLELVKVVQDCLKREQELVDEQEQLNVSL